MVALPNHSHCKYCGDPGPFGNEYCDDDCRELYLAEKSGTEHTTITQSPYIQERHESCFERIAAYG